MQDHPAHFGLFASLPLRDTDGAWQSLTTGNALGLLPRLNPPSTA